VLAELHPDIELAKTDFCISSSDYLSAKYFSDFYISCRRGCLSRAANLVPPSPFNRSLLKSPGKDNRRKIWLTIEDGAPLGDLPYWCFDQTI
jgi:hypothetical protein